MINHVEKGCEKSIPSKFEHQLIEAFDLILKMDRSKEDLEEAGKIILYLHQLLEEEQKIRKEENNENSSSNFEEERVLLALRSHFGWDCEKNEQLFLERLLQYHQDNQAKESKRQIMGYVLNIIGNIFLKRDKIKAKEYYEKSIDCGNSYGFTSLGQLYHRGKGGIESDLPKAIELYERASDLGNTEAMILLAQMFQFGNKSIEKNVNKAIELYQKAVDLGNSHALTNLGYIYQNGEDGIEKNIEKAIEFYQKASDLGNSYAIMLHAMICHYGDSDYKSNFNQAIELYQRASDLGNGDAAKSLANIYHFGEQGIKSDVMKAKDLYERAINFGNDYAMTSLAQIYEQGEGNVQKDLLRAVDLYRRAVDLVNDPEAMSSLAQIFEFGEEGIVEKDLEESASLYFKASLCDEENSEFYLDKFLDLISKEKIEWRTEYHRFWSFEDKRQVNQKLECLLLVSKHRRESKVRGVSFLVKGIMLSIIKHCCHFLQIFEDEKMREMKANQHDFFFN